MGARVIGLGQRAAGDDAVGLAILDEIRRKGPPPGVEILELADASDLVEGLRCRGPVIVVDAVLGARPGEVLELAPADVTSGALAPVSSHGLGVGQAIELAGVLAPAELAPTIRLVAVTVRRPGGACVGLSPEVAAAVPRAAERVLALAGAG